MKIAMNLLEAIPYAPKSEMMAKSLAGEIYAFARNQEELNRWHVAALRYFTKWQGFGPLRALYCQMFEPADGVYPTIAFEVDGKTTTAMPGFSEAEKLAAYQEQELAVRSQQIERYQHLIETAGAEANHFPLPDVKRLPAAPERARGAAAG